MAGYERADIITRTGNHQTSQKSEGVISISGQGIYDESSTANYDIGRRLCLGDGRVFHYCKNGTTALTVGKPVQSPVNRTEVDDISNATVGDSYVTLATTAGTYTQGQFANGYMIVHDVGHMYAIRDNDAITSGGSGNVYTYEPIGFATTSNDVTLFKNPCADVIALADPISFTLGVPLIAVTASYYFWCQTWGPCGALTVAGTDAAANRLVTAHYSGVSFMLSGDSAAAWVTGTTGAQRVGYNLYDSTGLTGAEYDLIYLTCMA